MSLRLTRTALKQIEEALDYIAERSPQGSEAFRLRINAGLDILREFPRAGQETDRPGFRRLILTPHPYAIVYRLAADDVVIMRLRHTARRPLG